MAEPTSTRAGIDPTLKALLDALPLQIRVADGVEAARQKMRQIEPPADLLPTMRIEERTIGFDDLTDIPARIYWPPIPAHDDLPVVVFYHGGGWSIGDLDTHDAVARAHAVGAEAIVVSVDYRLAPDSAGGNISAVMAQLARDHGGPPLVFQLLWYPATSADTSLPSHAENADAAILDAEAIEAFLTWYLPDVDVSEPDKLPTTLAPANAADLSGLPPAFIGTAEYDPLRDDGARYAELLTAAGVPVELRNEPTMVHGYVSFALVVPAAAEATNRGLAALKAAVSRR